jgi:hypothetical protein
MFKTLSKTLTLTIGALLVFSFTQVYAQQVSLQLNPRVSKVVTNYYPRMLNANCTIATPVKNKILISVLRNRGAVNGKILGHGQATAVKVSNRDNITVSAEPGTMVSLVNLGRSPVQAICFT